MKLLVIGLGNPGDKYMLTRHNVGFMALDSFAKKRKIKFKKIGRAYLLEYLEGSSSFYLIKPQTFMNLSVNAIRDLVVKEKFDEIAVIYDDADLPFGTLKVKKGGSSTHNGVRSIMELTENFIHIRVGIGRSNNLAEYVLTNFSREELEKLTALLSIVDNVIISLSNKSLQEVTNEFNGRAI